MNSKIILLIALALPSLSRAAANQHWVVSWGASPSPQTNATQMRTDNLTYENKTIREIVHSSIGSDTVRVRLSNAYGKESVQIGAAHIALSAKDTSLIAGTDQVLTFGGRPTVTIPPDGIVASDPVTLDVPASSDVAVSLYLPKATVGAGIHYASQQNTYIGAGDLTASATMPGAAKLESWVFLSNLDVVTPDQASTLVAFGDSITDGAQSTTDANHRWPNFLADRLRADQGRASVGVLDAGIGGNRVLHDAVNIRFGVNALARFDRDVLAQPAVKYLIVLEGINDLGHPGSSAPESETVSADELIAGLKQLADRAHENGIRVFGGTLTPFAGTTYKGYFTAEREYKRQAVNQWIRTGGAFDGVIDFDKAARDPHHPERLLPAYDSGDHLHPNDDGYRAMAESIDLSLFR